MRPTKITFLVLVLMARTLRAKVVIGTSSPDESISYLVEDLVEIVTSCYRDQINAVGLVGNLPDTLSRTLSVQHLIPITLMANTSRNMIDVANIVEPVSNEFRQKLQVFIVEASEDEINFIIEIIIHNSIWWNHMASFIILDQSPQCDNAINDLFISSVNNILNAKVLCYHHKYGSVIYNSNPFTTHAPFPWRQIYVGVGINNHPFTVFGQKYRRNKPICVNLDFVKTNDLGGYQIIVEGTPFLHRNRGKKWNALTESINKIIRMSHILIRALNCTWKYSGVDGDTLANGAKINLRYFYDTRFTTYPYEWSGIVLVSKFRGHKTQLEKILYVIDTDSRIGMGIVYLVTLIFLKFFVNQALGTTLLNLVRITCNTGFANLPNNTALRMYLTALLFFVVTMQGIYQGNLAALLTQKISVKNINSFEDIVNWGYKIYGFKDMARIIENAELKARLIPVDGPFECMDKVLDDSSAVCIIPAKNLVFDIARQHDLHLSSKYVAEFPSGFRIRSSWYLEERLNVILGRMMEADIFDTWKSKCNPITLADFKYDKEVRENKDFKNIEFAELRFAFVILGIGLLCATITFIVEVAIY